MDDQTKYWERPLSSRVPVYGFSPLDTAGMQEMGWSHMPSMEVSLAVEVSSIFDKIYKSSTQTGCATNAITLLLAYIVELEEEMTGALSQGNYVIELWVEICMVTDLVLCSLRCLAQSTGRTVGLVVVGQRALWLNLSTMGEKDKTHFLDQPVDPLAV